jgi:hypothetical protein
MAEARLQAWILFELRRIDRSKTNIAGSQR